MRGQGLESDLEFLRSLNAGWLTALQTPCKGRDLVRFLFEVFHENVLSHHRKSKSPGVVCRPLQNKLLPWEVKSMLGKGKAAKLIKAIAILLLEY